MRQSLYLILATTLIKADINNELRKIRKEQRAIRYTILHFNAHLLRDIGLQTDGFDTGEKFPAAIKATRMVRYLRHLHYVRMKT